LKSVNPSFLPHQVVAATSEEAKESASVGVLQEQLRALQADVDAASRRLAVTRSRVESNMKRVDDLRAEAVRPIYSGYQ